jgi:hypothetical protein
MYVDFLAVKDTLTQYMGVERGYRPLQSQRSHLLEIMPTSQAELPPRMPSDSYDSALIPLSKSQSLQEKYITFLGHVRTGRLMEDMDIFAGIYHIVLLYRVIMSN